MSAIICPSCKTPAPQGAIFCDNCGYDLRTVTVVDEGMKTSNEAYAGGIGGVPPPPTYAAPDQGRVRVTGDLSLPKGMILCSNCGHTNMAGSAFCENCGMQLAHDQKGSNEMASPRLAPTPPVPVQGSFAETLVEEKKAPGGAAAGDAHAGPALTMITGRLVILESQTPLPILPGNQMIVIGREDPVSGVFPEIDLDPHGGHEAGVGRRHAQLLIRNGQLFIEDLDSVNGTVVNKERLEPRKPHPVNNGDELRFGKMILVYYSN